MSLPQEERVREHHRAFFELLDELDGDGGDDGSGAPDGGGDV